MSETTTYELTPFQQWIVNSFTELGTAPAGVVDPLGLEFESDGRVARILPHTDPGLAVVEVVVEDLADKDEGTLSRLALQLLRLNDEARFEHGWQAVLDADDSLCIYVLISMASTSAEDLAGSLDDGMYRAGLLSEVLRGLLSDGPRDPTQATASVTSGMVRG
jgi:hypothetical protein